MPGIRLASLIRKLRRDAPDTGGRGDADLLARFAASRDESAFELLVWRHGAMVLAACRRALGHTEDAEDAFQAAFLVLARKAGSVRGSVPAWLHRVAVRIAGKVARKRRPTAVLAVEPAARASPDAVELGDLRGVLDAEIDRLSEPYRRAFVLCYLEGLSNADAARLIGCPVGTIESRLTAARKKLRARLSRRNVELPAGALALLGAQTGLAKEMVAVVVRACTTAAECGVNAAVGIVREPAAKLAQGVLVMTKLRTASVVSLGVALLGLAAGAGWAGMSADPPVLIQPEVAAAEPAVAPQPTPKDAKPGDGWPAARKLDAQGYSLAGVGTDGTSLILSDQHGTRGYSLTGKPAGYRAYSTNTVLATAFSQDGKHAVTAEGVNGVKFRDAKTGEVVEGLWPSGDMPAQQVAFTADGSKFVVVCSRTTTANPFGGGGREFGQMTAEERAKAFEMAKKGAGGKGGAAKGKSGTSYRVSVWDTATRKELRGTTEDMTGTSAQLALAGHGRFVLKTELVTMRGEDGEDRFEVRRYTITDPVTNKAVGTVDSKDAAHTFGRDPLSADGGTLALIDTNALRFVDTSTGKERFRTPPFRRPLKAMAFSPDGRFVAAATGVGTRISTANGLDGIAAPSEVVVWDLASGKELARLVDQAQIRNHSALAFSPDGSFLASQSFAASEGGGFNRDADITLWGRPPAESKPEPKPAPKKAAPAPADVPDRFQALFTSLAANDTTDAKRVESLFLAALGRLPSDVEARTLGAQLAKRSDKAEALKDLLGTLVETAEFKAHAEALGRLAK